MSLEVVAITGSSGFLAQHLIAYLQNNATDMIKEIRAIDRKPFKKFLDYPLKIPIRHYEFDICNKLELEYALSSCTTIFHCAAKPFEFVYSEENPIDQYWHDNVNATETLVDTMQSFHIPRLIFLGDAYSMLASGDNYGLSEYMHESMPNNFMLGIYGESKARAEFVIRKATQTGSINAMILRPTFIFGEGETHLVSMAEKVCSKNGGIPVIDGDDRGNHQFIYAGNMAAIMEKSMRCLKRDAAYYNGEIIFCTDQTICTPFKNFIKPYMEAIGFEACNSVSYLRSWLSAVYNSALAKIGSKQCFGHLTLNAHRFLNGWTVGFSNRKLRLLLDFVPPFEQDEAMKQSIEWFKTNEAAKRTQTSTATTVKRPKMG
uniref:3Beta_HSD domain-containing protein n=1 Tax=Ascaris lumbricoides TaxID=6252 RepID=A0A0M3HTY5_ASCLU